MEKQLLKTIEQLSNYDSYRGICNEQPNNEPLPSQEKLAEIILLVRSLVFPGFFGNSSVDTNNVAYHTGVNAERLLQVLTAQIRAGLCFCSQANTTDTAALAREKALAFIERLPDIRRLMQTDVEAAYKGDPAAKNFGEIICCYPAIKALSNYRMAHELLLLDVPIIPRMITEMAHSETGIDIHPGAKIGSHFMIDHGTGVVIGETTIIGNNVKMYQGVTLGAKTFPLDADGNPIKGIKRHPNIEDDVIIYSNSTILGNITIGKGAVIGGNIWVDTDIPAGAKIVQRK